MEKWKEIYTEEQIRKIQKLELNNLKVLKSVCEKIGVDFFAYGGTLIGAVRHKGFIPWDDDLDIAMIRSDYDKFLAEAPQYLPEEYVLQTPYNTPKTPYPYTKLRLKGTKYVEYGYHKLNIEHGIYIDIYPIDNLPDDSTEYYKLFKKYQRVVKLYAWRQCPYIGVPSSSFKQSIKGIVKFALSLFLKLIPQQKFVKTIDDIATKYNNIETNRKGNLNFPHPKNFFYNILPYEQGEFEGISIFLPGGWDNHLKSRYNDYMKLPAENERIGHMPYLLDLGEN